MYQAVLYFNGPKTRWSGQIDAEEVIANISARWKWLIRAHARSAHSNLDPSRCGYIILKDGIAVEHVEALNE